jgi:hypothetical protein
MVEKRRFPRFKVPPRFRVKARVKLMGEKKIDYFNVENLSMNGASLVAKKNFLLSAKPGDLVEITLIGGGISLKCVARLVQRRLIDEKNSHPQASQIGIEIVGADEKSRKTLVDFLEKIAQTDAHSNTMAAV